MTFSRCRRLNVHRKTGYPSFLYPLANVRPLTTMSWRGNWCTLWTTKRWKPIFYHVSSLFFILLSWARDVRYVTSKAQDDTLFYRLPMTSSCRYPGLTTLHNCTFAMPVVRLGTSIELTTGTAIASSHHLLNCSTEWHIFIVPLYLYWHSNSYTKDYQSEQSYVFLRTNHCISLHVI